jgi:hypothetical protein
MQKIRILSGDEVQVTTFSKSVLQAISMATGGVAGVISDVVKNRLREKAGNYPEGELLSRSEKRLYDMYHAFGGEAKDWNRWYAEFRQAGYDHPKVKAFLKDGTLELTHLDIKP